MAEGKNDLLRMTKLTLQNFRCFEYKEVEFSEQFNVLVGDNGVGKTAILDALAMGICGPFHAVAAWSEPPITFRQDDTRRTVQASEGVYQVTPGGRAMVAWDALVDGRSMVWDLSGLLLADVPASVNWVWEQVLVPRLTAASSLPLVAYYTPQRASTRGDGLEVDTLGPLSRSDGYADCMGSGLDPLPFLRWFKTLDLAQLQENNEIPALSAAKNAIKRCLGGDGEVTNVRWLIREGDLVIERVEGPPIPFRMLSHGQRAMLAMVADMAWRASVINPFMEDPVANTPGVVLIDEIDLHLHPKRQRRVVDDLRRTFPLVQFIATTHSPFIVQGLKPGELINLDKQEGEPPSDYWRESPEDIVEKEMGVELPQRSERYQQMAKAAEEYYRLLRQGETADEDEKARLRARLDELTEPFADNVAFSTFLRMERQAAGLGEVNQ